MTLQSVTPATASIESGALPANAHLELPPMVSGAKPMVGHSLEYLKNPVEFLTRGYHECGPVYAIQLGNRYSVVALGPDHNKFFFSETDKLLSIREGYPFFLKMFSNDFYFFAKKDDYMKQREIVMPKVKVSAMKSYVGIMTQETEELIERLGDSGDFDLIPTLGPLVMNVAAHSFLGSDFRGKLDDGFFEDFRDFSGGMEVIWPLWLPLKHLRKCQAAKKKLHKVLREWIQYRRDNPMDPPDFFQSLIESSLKDGTPVTEDLCVNLILLLVWAGHETTAGQISWSMIDLCQHPAFLNNVRQQTVDVMGGRPFTEMTWDDAVSMKHVENGIKESERLHPVAYTLMRKVTEDITIGGYKVPKDAYLFSAPCVSHRMPEVFPQPHAYDPDRWDNSDGTVNIESNALVGFGGGVHRCAGVNFARLEMKIILTMLAHHYDLELIDTPRPISGPMTYWPAQPMRVRYSKRTPDAPTATAAASATAEPAEASGGACPFHP